MVFMNPIYKKESHWGFLDILMLLSHFFRTKQLLACYLEIIWIFIFRIYSALTGMFLDHKLEFDVVKTKST